MAIVCQSNVADAEGVESARSRTKWPVLYSISWDIISSIIMS